MEIMISKYFLIIFNITYFAIVNKILHQNVYETGREL